MIGTTIAAMLLRTRLLDQANAPSESERASPTNRPWVRGSTAKTIAILITIVHDCDHCDSEYHYYFIATAATTTKRAKDSIDCGTHCANSAWRAFGIQMCVPSVAILHK